MRREDGKRMVLGVSAALSEAEVHWRGLILLVRNSASYKFALGKSLLELRPQAGSIITLDELAVPFSRNITEHLKLADKQCTNSKSRFLDTCRKFNRGEVDQNELVEQTVQLGFQNVIDAFHNIRTGGEIPKRFYEDHRSTDGGIKITEEFHELTSGFQVANLLEQD